MGLWWWFQYIVLLFTQGYKWVPARVEVVIVFATEPLECPGLYTPQGAGERLQAYYGYNDSRTHVKYIDMIIL